ncbi:Uu.00g129360.m01.CDS01 [Anthostomella pinea]|uniref:Uu.00g129360.m01.CDS01 n=1 Tax=Anthostomella pinea TaxID=933095 RepID=A0AAI8VD63_9PEZI|nr:Uu.00g129360.m01.CDS01 [Anthostomella pinea]
MPFMLTPQFVRLSALALLLTAAVVLVRRWSSPYAKVPGPWYSQWTDLVFKLHTLAGKESSYIHSLHQRYGPVVRVSPGAVDAISAADAQQIHSIKRLFVKSKWYGDFIPGNENLVNVQNIDVHRRHRRLLSAPLSESNLKAMLPQVDSKVEVAIQQMKKEMGTRGAADVLKWWTCVATDVIGELTFGESFRTLDTGEKNQYMLDLEVTGATNAMMASFPTLYRFAQFLPVLKEAAAVQDRLRSYADQSLRRYRDLLEEKPDEVKATLFTKVYKGEDDETLTNKEINEEAQIYIVAGSDTTANSLTYLTWRLCLPENAHIKAKLVRELATLPGPKPTDTELRGLPYLNNVITETLRLHSAVAGALRRVIPQGGATIGGYSLPAGGEVMTNAYSLHRNAAAFTDPDKFDPDRWVNPTRDMKDAYLPFGGGSRGTSQLAPKQILPLS